MDGSSNARTPDWTGCAISTVGSWRWCRAAKVRPALGNWLLPLRASECCLPAGRLRHTHIGWARARRGMANGYSVKHFQGALGRPSAAVPTGRIASLWVVFSYLLACRLNWIDFCLPTAGCGPGAPGGLGSWTTFIGGYFGRAMTTTTQGTVAEKPRREATVTVALNRWLRPAATDSGPHSRDPSRTGRSRPG